MEALEQTELSGRAVGDANVRVVAVDVAAKCPGEKARSVVGDQERRRGQRSVQPLGLGARGTSSAALTSAAR